MKEQNEAPEVNLELSRTLLTNPLNEDFDARYGGVPIRIPANATVSIATLAAKVVGRHLVRRAIQVNEAEYAKANGLEMATLTVDPDMIAKYSTLVFGEVDEFGNPVAKSLEQQIAEQVQVVTPRNTEEGEEVENMGWKNLVAEAKERGVYENGMKRTAVEKAVKEARGTK